MKNYNHIAETSTSTVVAEYTPAAELKKMIIPKSHTLKEYYGHCGRRTAISEILKQVQEDLQIA
jgi:hypothetical protein